MKVAVIFRSLKPLKFSLLFRFIIPLLLFFAQIFQNKFEMYADDMSLTNLTENGNSEFGCEKHCHKESPKTYHPIASSTPWHGDKCNEEYTHTINPFLQNYRDYKLHDKRPTSYGMTPQNPFGDIEICQDFSSPVHPHVSNTNNSVRRTIRNPILQPKTYNGKQSLHEYLQHFNYCSKINSWGEYEKGIFLAASLTDEAASILVGKSDSIGFHELTQLLENRFGPAKSALYKSELRARRQRKGENYQSLAEDIRRLTFLAYPELPETVQQNLACDAFVDAIMYDDARRFVLQNVPTTLKEAVENARQFEAIRARERDRNMDHFASKPVRVVEKESENELREILGSLREDIVSLKLENATLRQEMKSLCTGARPKTRSDNKSGNVNANKPFRCWNCGEYGHMRKECLNSKGQGGPVASTQVP